MKRSLLLFLFGLFAAVAGAQSLDYVQIGSAGNLYTIIVGQTNMIDADQDLNTIIFIHRNNDQKYGGTNGMYRYDVSKDGGNTWSIDNGVLNPSANTTDKNARYPQAAIYNPAMNTNPDSAYLVYLGASHNNGDWDAVFYGSAQLDGTDFNETHEIVNNGNVLYTRGLTEGLPGEYWAVDFEYDNTNLTGDIIVYKGTFNPATKTFNVAVDRKLTPPHDLSLDGTVSATSLNMAFDPSGLNGWIMFLGDITSGAPYNLNPVFYETNDGGVTWTGPTEVDLESLSDLMNDLDTTGTGSTLTTGFDADIVVDMNGNPHVGVVVGYGSNYSIASTGDLRMIDVTYSSSTASWEAIVIDSVQTFRGTFGSLSEDNRPQASRTEAGDRVFLFWLDSDPNMTGGTNDAPNLKGTGINIKNSYRTPSKNFTQGDVRWDGLAVYSSASPSALDYENQNYSNIPTVFTEIITSDLEPVNFYYIQDINFAYDEYSICTDPAADPTIALSGADTITLGLCPKSFNDPWAKAYSCNAEITSNIDTIGSVDTNTIGTYTIQYYAVDPISSVSTDTVERVVIVTLRDLTDPVISLVGSDTVCIGVDSTYGELGATATDNCAGDLSSSVQIDGTVNNSTAGNYTLTYSVADTAGNTDTTSRVVRVVEVPTPAFELSLVVPGTSGFEAYFKNLSGAGAESYLWDFGDGNSSTKTDADHIYDFPGTYTVCLTASNCGGSQKTCDEILISSIDEILPQSSVNIHPNPSTGVINIEMTENTGDVTVEVYNLIGELIEVKAVDKVSAKETIQLNLSNKANGVYFIKVKVEDGVITKKVVISNQ